MKKNKITLVDIVDAGNRFNPLTVDALEHLGYRFTWSKKILKENDVVVFRNLISYTRLWRVTDKRLKGKLTILFVVDPLSIRRGLLGAWPQ